MSGRKGLAAFVLAAIACAIVMTGCCSLGLKTCSTNDELVFVGDQEIGRASCRERV